MAKIVGPTGQVIAVDLQSGMLGRVKKKATQHGVDDQIVTHQCSANTIDLQCAADFILAFYMVHETPDPGRFFEETKAMLKADGKLLVVEPKMHVRQAVFGSMVEDAVRAGLQAVGFPTGKGGRAVLLTHG